MSELKRATLETLTKEKAEEYFGLNKRNRKINERRVTKYVHDMNAGIWEIVPDAIAFNRKGELTNGQHRLKAFIKSDLNTIQFFVVKGLEESAFEVTDSGRSRNAADVLSILEYKYCNALATAARFVYHYEKWGGDEGSMALKEYVSHNEIAAIVDNNTGLVECTYDVQGWKKQRSKMISESAFLAFIFYLYSRANSVAYECSKVFCRQVVTGIGLDEDDPAYLLRERLMADSQAKKPMRRIERRAIILKAFNAYLQDKKLTRLNWNYKSAVKPEAFPPIFTEREINKICHFE